MTSTPKIVRILQRVFMDTDEFYFIMLLGFILGITGLVYYPGIVRAIVPYVAILGAFYLVVGIISRMFGSTVGIGASRKEDWMYGFGILLLVGMFLGFTELAVNSVQLMVGLFIGILKFILTA